MSCEGNKLLCNSYVILNKVEYCLSVIGICINCNFTSNILEIYLYIISVFDVFLNSTLLPHFKRSFLYHCCYLCTCTSFFGYRVSFQSFKQQLHFLDIYNITSCYIYEVRARKLEREHFLKMSRVRTKKHLQN